MYLIGYAGFLISVACMAEMASMSVVFLPLIFPVAHISLGTGLPLLEASIIGFPSSLQKAARNF